jgi:uncharacterized protein YbjT (DUF2867 family)
MSKTISIIGASGLIGNEVLRLAMENKEIERVTIFVRKSLHLNNPKLIEEITDFKNLNNLETKINGDALICCFGTTRKKTPNLEEYKMIDFNLTINLAQIAKKQNIEQVHLISAIGANPKSKIFYNRFKGETEEALINIEFPQTFIYRPSLLIGKRNEYRFGELLAQKLSPIFDVLLFESLKKYHSISASNIAKTIVNRVLHKGQKVEVLEYNEIQLPK